MSPSLAELLHPLLPSPSPFFLSPNFSLIFLVLSGVLEELAVLEAWFWGGECLDFGVSVLSDSGDLCNLIGALFGTFCGLMNT